MYSNMLWPPTRPCSSTEESSCFIQEAGNRLGIVESAAEGHENNTFTQNCTILKMTNLATPQWLLGDCKEKLLPDVVCMKSIAAVENCSLFSAEAGVCQEISILFRNLCYLFQTVDNHHSHNDSVIIGESCQKFSKQVLSNQSDNIFETILKATNVESMQYLVRDISSKGKQMQIVEYHWMWMSINRKTIPSYSGKELTSAFFICHSPAAKLHKSLILFKCKNDQYISMSYKCDGNSDCLDGKNFGNNLKSSDEMMCMSFLDGSVFCRNEPKDRRSICLALLVNSTNAALSAKHKQNEVHVRKFSLPTLPCPLKCRGEDEDCFQMKDICIFKVNRNNILIPCKNGDHIQDCTEFECNENFKCPKYYCVPWRHICDGTWHCPQGSDEIFTACSGPRICYNLLKCQGGTRCIHPLNVCDGENDCYLGDDELQCDLYFASCVPGCKCLHYGLACENTIVSNQSAAMMLPFSFLHLVLCNLTSMSQVLTSHHTLFVNASHNLISDMCSSSFRSVPTFALDFSHNIIRRMKTGCLSNVHFLRLLLLNNNQLMEIQHEMVTNVTVPLSVDLSNNKLNTILEGTFAGVLKIVALNLENNPLTNLVEDMFNSLALETIRTDNFLVCCLKVEGTQCQTEKPWFVSCSHLLPGDVLKFIVLGISVSAVVLNLSVVVFRAWQCVAKQNKNKCRERGIISEGKIGPYDLTVFFISAGDTATVCYFWILGVSEFMYAHSFAVMQQQWKSSLLCSAAYTSSLILHLLTPLLMGFLSLSRTTVVLRPMSLVFKSTDSVFKYLTCLTTAVLFVGFTLSMTFSLLFSMPSILCLPFIDPQNSHWEVVFNVSLMTLTQLLSISVTTSSIFLLIHSLQTHKKLSGKKHTSNKVLSKLLLSWTSMLLSWLPASALFWVLFWVSEYSLEVILWVLLLGTNINSFVNPVMFLVFG